MFSISRPPGLKNEKRMIVNSAIDPAFFNKLTNTFILSVSFKFQQDSKLNLSYKSIQEMIRSKGLIEENLTSYDVFDLVSQIRKKSSRIINLIQMSEVF